LIQKFPGLSLVNFTWSEFAWAHAAVSSRQNPVTLLRDGEPWRCLALCPVWDMFNHIDGESVNTFMDQNGTTLVNVAMKDYQPEQQVYIFYGKRHNGEFMMYQGFVCENNSHSFVPMRLAVNSEKLKSLCKEIGCPS
jgi:hypothetical protein